MLTVEGGDGVSAKGTELVMVLTTNRLEDIPKGMLRPGRVDPTIKIADLDRGGTERLIKAVVEPDLLSDDVDYDEFFASTAGYLPAFVREVASSALLYAIARSKGGVNFKLTTEDFVAAALSLRDQYDKYDNATELSPRSNIEEALVGVVRRSLNGAEVMDGYDSKFTISTEDIDDNL